MLRLRWLLALVIPFAAGCPAEVDDMPMGVGPPEPPFAVSAYFAPSGFMGDGANPEGTALVADTDASTCLDRPDGARGDCYRFTYTAGANRWAGVYWQFPPNNWGSLEGKEIAPGATTVSFYAASAAGGETLNVTVGGIRDITLPYSDTIKAESSVTLTTELTKYTVDISAQNYDKVIGAFSWSIALPEGGDASTPIVLYLDDVVWE